MEGLGTSLAFPDSSCCMANSAFCWDFEDTHGFCYVDNLRDNLVCLDDLQFASLASNAQSLAFAYVAE